MSELVESLISEIQYGDITINQIINKLEHIKLELEELK
jgi:hypothetical protein